MTPSESRTVFTEVMQPTDANFHGRAFGGRLLALMDLCAYTTAVRYSGQVCVTASFDRVDFLAPVDVGDIVTMEAVVGYVGRTSIEVVIEVSAENPFTRERRATNSARVTMVAVRDGRPVEVPALDLETREDKIRFVQGRLRRDLRKAFSAERVRQQEEVAAMSEAELDRALTA